MEVAITRTHSSIKNTQIQFSKFKSAQTSKLTGYAFTYAHTHLGLGDVMIMYQATIELCLKVEIFAICSTAEL